MLNKKIIAAVVAAAFAHGASAAVDLTDSDTVVTFANDVTGYSLETDGTLEVTNLANLLDATAELGFTIGNNTSKYVLVQLDGATFGAVPTLDVAGTAGSISQGGTVGSSFVIFEVSPTAGDLAQSALVTLAAATYNIDPAVTSTVSYKLFETASDAVSALADDNVTSLSSTTGGFTKVGSGSSGVFAVAETATATVASDFTEFDDSAANIATTTVGYVGYIDTSELVADPSYTAAGVLTTELDYLTDSQEFTITGDFSFGDAWTIEDVAACDGSGATIAATINADGTALESDAAELDTTLAAGPWYLCVDNASADTIEKGSYTVTLEDDELTNDIGTIKYDTTSIEVPYITTYYNQRIILVNSSSVDAEYSITFRTEDGTTATAGADATGTIPAKGMIVLATQKDDLVTFDGKTRGSATIEVESVDSNIQAATQTTSADGNSTDTVILNANSTVSYNELVKLVTP